MELIRDFGQLNKNDAAIAGGKGASLGEMTQAGIPVPPGFVILSDAFEQFIEETELKADIDSALHQVNHEEVHTVEKASEEIKALILEEEIPKDIAAEIQKHFKKLGATWVAVRSSATAEDSSEAAWAGQLESYLNTTEKTLLENVKRCWASLFTPRAIFYRFEKKLHEQKISVAVVVQKMVESEVSGIAFSVHPVTQDYNQLIIEAGFGLGEAIVSGSITPDSYVVEKKGWLILDKHISSQNRALVKGKNGGNEWIDLAEEKGKQPVLNEKEILELSKLVVRIEQHYGFPVDVEWCREKGRFFIVQSRPITTLKNAASTDSLVPDLVSFELVNTRNMQVWFAELHNHGLYHHMHDFGVSYSLPVITLTVAGKSTSIFANPKMVFKCGTEILALAKTPAGLKTLAKNYEKNAKRLLAASTAFSRKPTSKNWRLFATETSRFSAGLHITLNLGRRGSDELAQALSAVYANGNEGLIAELTYPSRPTPLFESQMELLRIGRRIQEKKVGPTDSKKQLQKWLDTFSHIPVNFCDEAWTLSNAREQLQEVLKKNCSMELNRLESAQKEKKAEAHRLLKKFGETTVVRLALALQETAFLNEYRKNIFSKALLQVRPALDALAKKNGLNDWKDLNGFLSDEIEGLLDKKKKDSPPVPRNLVGLSIDQKGKRILLDEKQCTALFQRIKSVSGTDKTGSFGPVSGFVANKGVACGTARIILGSEDFSKFKTNDVLVTTMTSVDFIPIMQKAAAFVTDEGGITSHAAIVAREMNKPCIIGTKIATKVLKSGDLVEVDANHGIVKKIKE